MISLLTGIILFYLAINFFGFLLEKVKIPKIYAALFLGIILGINKQVIDIVNLPVPQTLIQLGMFLLLFLLGFNLNLKELKKQRHLIVRITSLIILSEMAVGILLLHYLFAVEWILAGIISISFATVGEVALLPILKEFKLTKTKLGQTILGVSVLDDVVEIVAFILLIFFISSFKMAEIVQEFIPLIAIIAGLISRKISSRFDNLEKIVNVLALAVFGPFFFFYAGTEANLMIILNQFLLILLITLLIKITKLVSAYIASRKQLGTKKALILGLSLCIKFSTSIIILIILSEKNLITKELFSILIGIKVLFKLIVPILLSYFIGKWQLELIPTKKMSLSNG